MKHRGFTLIEIVLVFGILAVLSMLVILGWSSVGVHTRSEEVNQQVLSLIRQAREKTLARVGGYAYGVHLQPTEIALFVAPTYVSGAASNTAYVIPSGFRIAAYSLRGGGSDIIFQPLTGETGQDGTITVTSTATSKTIHVYASGYADVQ